MLNSHFHMEMHLKCEEWPRESSRGWLLNGLRNCFTVDAWEPHFPVLLRSELWPWPSFSAFWKDVKWITTVVVTTTGCTSCISQQDEISERHHPMHVNIVVCLAPQGKDMKYEIFTHILQYDIMGFTNHFVDLYKIFKRKTLCNFELYHWIFIASVKVSTIGPRLCCTISARAKLAPKTSP